MTALGRIFAEFRRTHGLPLGLGALLALLAVGAATALLGLSGWFVAAAAGAGLASGALTPSLAMRILALLRMGARYGERMATHDATLRFLAELRGGLYRRLAAGPWSALGRLRRGAALGRFTADVDALDGFYLRLLLPAATAAIALTLGGAALWWIAGPVVALATIAPLLLAGGLALRLGAARGEKAARRRLAALDALRLRTLDLMSATPEYAAADRLDDQVAAIAHAAKRSAAAEAELRRLDTLLGAATSLAGDLAIAGALWASLMLAGAGAPIAAIAALTAFGLFETVAPLRRGAIEFGAQAQAARRIAPQLAPPPAEAAQKLTPADNGSGLILSGVGYAYAQGRAPVLRALDLQLRPGEVVALEGASGSGKSTALAIAAGVLSPGEGEVILGGAPLAHWPEPALRRALGWLPQRTELLGPTLGDALRLGAPNASDEALWAALEAVEMAEAARAAGGLEAGLGAGGVGFSGGESRRIALARLLLRRTPVLLLDEPTEGLRADQAARVLDNILREADGAAVLIASHRPEERARAGRVLEF